MKRYYFDLLDGDTLAVDDEGLDLKTLQDATDEAERALALFASRADQDPLNEHLRGWNIQVRDKKGRVTEVSRPIPTRH